ncbi:hypothetical protein H0H87_011511 [Tephrocybe sp. NHM501043]|nr:hypothetical protein H0H87_011511 [Tephrocybe sp. NHM501043]
MSAERPEAHDAPSAHLGVKWEIVLVTVFGAFHVVSASFLEFNNSITVVVLFVILGTLWFQIHRKRRRGQMDAEAVASFQSRPRSSREKGDGVYSGLAMPDPIANPPRRNKYSRSMASSPTSSYYEREISSHKPTAPRYYWDQR